MRYPLGVFSFVVLGSLIGVSIWATGHQSVAPALRSLWAEPAAGNNPWFWATLFDAYFGFTWFWLWVAYREHTWPARLAWLVAIFALGNMAMAAYVLVSLWRLPKDAPVEALLLKRV